MTPERLQAISQVVAFLGAILAGLGSLGAWWFGNRVQATQDRQREAHEQATSAKLDSLLSGNAELQNRLKPFESMAKERFPDLPAEEALRKLSDEVGELKERTTAVERGVRQISGEVSFTVVGTWSAPLVPGTSRPVAPNREQPFISLVSDKPEAFPAVVMTLLDISRENLDAETAKVWLRAQTPDGRWPLGQDIKVLEHYRKLEIVLPMISRPEAVGGELSIKRTSISLSVNGVSIFRRDESRPIRVVLPETGWRVINLEYEKPILQDRKSSGPDS